MLANRLKTYLFLVLGIIPTCLSFGYSPNPNPRPEVLEKMYKDLFIDLTDQELEQRIMNITNLFEPKFTSEVKGFLRIYLTARPLWSQTLLGRTSIYFPIFERKIEEKGMPNDVKVISVIESALRTSARSRVGAQGLWQFMPGTAKENELVIDKLVDEREDPYRATDAALEYLHHLHSLYNDWALAIAAYNSGPGRVNQAIRFSGSRDFWQLRNYLPKETRNYVPAFLAAAYMLKHYSEYYLTPDVPRLDFQITKHFKIYSEISFAQIASITGLSVTDIQFLNTAYRQDFIPTNTKGFTLLLPSRVAPLMDAYIHNIEGQNLQVKKAESTHEPIDSSMLDQIYYNHVSYDAQQGEKLQDIADLFSVDKYNIRHWNSMSSDDINYSNPLIIHYVKNENRISVGNKEKKFVKRNKYSGIKLPALPLKTSLTKPKALPISDTPIKAATSSMLNLDINTNYRLRRGESLQDVLRKYPHLSMDDIQSSLKTSTKVGTSVVTISSK